MILPALGLEYDALLYSMFAISALHLSKTEPHGLEATNAYRKYLDMALRWHSHDVTHLSKTNADAVCLTSSLIRVNSFVVLQERSLTPYTPPMQWIKVTLGGGSVLKAAWEWIGDDTSSIAGRLVKRIPQFLNESTLYQESNRRGLSHLLEWRRDERLAEPWSTDIEEAYASTIGYIGSVQVAIAAHEAPEDICRKLIAFPMFMQKPFIDSVEQQQPRALVLLAHYFALLAMCKDVWWLGDAGQREVRGIQTVLPDDWQELMSWPLKVMEERLQFL